jgi:hypothetical protein|nr:MAG: hypothetical protein [Bacteriophage sp.]
MDYEKLIKAVNLCGSTPKVEQCKKCAYWAGGDMSKCIPRMTTDAATALSTLQDENKLLREKVEDARLEGYAKGIGEMCAELEQVKQERDELERFLGELEGAVYSGQYFHLRPMIEKWHGQKED